MDIWKIYDFLPHDLLLVKFEVYGKPSLNQIT